MGTFVVDIVPIDCQDSVLKKLINHNFREFLESNLPPHAYPLNESEYVGQAIFDALVDYVCTDTESYLYNKYDYNQIKNFVLYCGVTPEHIVDWLKNLFKKNRIVKSLSVIFEEDKNHKTKKINKTIKEEYVQILNDYLSNNNINCEEITEDEINDDKNSIVWAVRSKYGDFPVKFYKTTNTDDSIIKYIVKYTYAINTLCNYYEVREITYNKWINLDDKHKLATSPKE